MWRGRAGHCEAQIDSAVSCAGTFTLITMKCFCALLDHTRHVIDPWIWSSKICGITSHTVWHASWHTGIRWSTGFSRLGVHHADLGSPCVPTVTAAVNITAGNILTQCRASATSLISNGDKCKHQVQPGPMQQFPYGFGGHRATDVALGLAGFNSGMQQMGAEYKDPLIERPLSGTHTHTTCLSIDGGEFSSAQGWCCCKSAAQLVVHRNR
jgi:hypothetical protein